MSDSSNVISLVDDDVNVHSTDSIAGTGSRMVGVASNVSSSSWVPISGLLLVIWLLFHISAHFLLLFLWAILLRQVTWVLLLSKFGNMLSLIGVFGMFIWSIILAILVVAHFLMFWIIHNWILLHVLVGRSLLSFECRKVRKKKGCDSILCVFYVRVVFDRIFVSYVVKVYRLSRLDHVVIFLSIVGNVKFEADVSTKEMS